MDMLQAYADLFEGPGEHRTVVMGCHRIFLPHGAPGSLSPIFPQSTGIAMETSHRSRRLPGVTRWLVDAA
jgi:hypothetical protein